MSDTEHSLQECACVVTPHTSCLHRERCACPCHEERFGERMNGDHEPEVFDSLKAARESINDYSFNRIPTPRGDRCYCGKDGAHMRTEACKPMQKDTACESNQTSCPCVRMDDPRIICRTELLELFTDQRDEYLRLAIEAMAETEDKDALRYLAAADAVRQMLDEVRYSTKHAPDHECSPSNTPRIPASTHQGETVDIRTYTYASGYMQGARDERKAWMDFMNDEKPGQEQAEAHIPEQDNAEARFRTAEPGELL